MPLGAVPSVDMDFHIALKDLTRLVERLPCSAFLGVAEREQFTGFVEGSRGTRSSVRRVSTAVALLTRVAHAEGGAN